jgi:hypothetical protein
VEPEHLGGEQHKPGVLSHGRPLSEIPSAMPARATADPASSHFSCWRRIPDERRKLSAWPASETSQQVSSSGKNRFWTRFHHP